MEQVFKQQQTLNSNKLLSDLEPIKVSPSNALEPIKAPSKELEEGLLNALKIYPDAYIAGDKIVSNYLNSFIDVLIHELVIVNDQMIVQSYISTMTAGCVYSDMAFVIGNVYDSNKYISIGWVQFLTRWRVSQYFIDDLKSYIKGFACGVECKPCFAISLETGSIFY